MTQNQAMHKLVKVTPPWQNLALSIDEVNPIKSMITPEESFYLHWLTREKYQGLGEIVDAGCLLGGSTLALATGLVKNVAVSNKDKRIHSYDLFVYEKYMAGICPQPDLKPGDSLLPFFKENTKMYEDYIEVYSGSILDCQWTGIPIEILFIDLAKSWEINDYVIKQFFGSLIPGQSIVVHQDYFHFRCYWIHLTMQYLGPYFEVVYASNGPTLAFKLIKPLPEDLLNIDYSSFFSKEEAIDLMDAAIATHDGTHKSVVMTAKVQLLVELGEYQQARALVKEIKASSNQNYVRFNVDKVEARNPIIQDDSLPSPAISGNGSHQQLNQDRRVGELLDSVDELKKQFEQLQQSHLDQEQQIVLLQQTLNGLAKHEAKPENKISGGLARSLYHRLVPLKARLFLRDLRVHMIGH